MTKIMTKTGTMHFSVTGEFMTHMSRTLYWDDLEFDKGLHLLTAGLMGMTEKIAIDIIFGRKKLIGTNDLDIVDDTSDFKKTHADILKVAKRKFKPEIEEEFIQQQEMWRLGYNEDGEQIWRATGTGEKCTDIKCKYCSGKKCCYGGWNHKTPGSISGRYCDQEECHMRRVERGEAGAVNLQNEHEFGKIKREKSEIQVAEEMVAGRGKKNGDACKDTTCKFICDGKHCSYGGWNAGFGCYNENPERSEKLMASLLAKARSSSFGFDKDLTHSSMQELADKTMDEMLDKAGDEPVIVHKNIVSPHGWLSPKGTYYEVGLFQHTQTAGEVAKLEGVKVDREDAQHCLDRHGFIIVSKGNLRTPFQKTKFTPQQYSKLKAYYKDKHWKILINNRIFWDVVAGLKVTEKDAHGTDGGDEKATTEEIVNMQLRGQPYINGGK